MEPSSPENSCLSTLKNPSGWGARHTIISLAFIGFAASYSMRFNLSLAIVAMVNKQPTVGLNNNSLTGKEESCLKLKVMDAEKQEETSATSAAGEFSWNEAEQGVILGSFFWGYVITQIPAGIVSQKYGGKWPYGLGLALTAIFALLTPPAARWNKSVLIFVRIIQGVGEGLTVPSFHVILSKWAPPQERSNLAAIAYGGAQFGTAVTMILGGAIIQSNFLGGWPGIFYSIGIFTLGWFALWVIFMFDEPAEHPRIHPDELHYIQKSLSDQSNKDKMQTPWRNIWTSLPVWAIVIGHMGHNWGQYTLLTELPTYLRTALHFDIKQNSLVSALPFTAMWIFSCISTRFADMLIKKEIFRVVVVRKLCQTVAHLGAALALIAASYSGCDRVLTVALLTVAAGVSGAAYGGYSINHIDIASNHAGVLMGITNTFANMNGFAAPYVAGLIVNENASLGNWQIVFFLAAGIYIVESIFFIVFATSDEQPWNRPTLPKNDVKLECQTGVSATTD